ncbi:hypothetical protein LWI29_001124 [Acer saccharum]|uniref:Uncharacterized protein n=1 Tax=Acer saccharum TaxID=4024 RepID=A0AA39W5E8_ACESA|nr:hypothetical protein LWI29_001124 [Acer saccharum]
METATIANNIEEKYSFEILDYVYSAAADGDINKLQEHAKRLDQILTPNGNTILHIHITARRPRSRISNNFVRVKSLLDECKKTYQNHHDQELGIKSTKLMLQMPNEAKDTALHEAVRYNHLDVVQLLTKEDPSLPYDANTADDAGVLLTLRRRRRRGDVDVAVDVATRRRSQRTRCDEEGVMFDKGEVDDGGWRDGNSTTMLAATAGM